MKKRSANRFFLSLALLTLIAIAAVPFLGWIAWSLAPERNLDVLVYNSTVFTADRRQHQAATLMLDHLKVPFDGDVDYVGAEPGGLSFGTWPDTPPGLVLLADAYGVYVNERAELDEEGSIRISQTFPANRADDVAAWSEAGSVVMGEFNILHEPTDPATSEVLQEMFSIDATGWTGRFFDDLQDASEPLQELHGRAWAYEGPGILLVGANAGDRGLDPVVEVLLPEHLDELAPTVSGDLMDRGREIDLSYKSWFALVETIGNADTDLWIELPVNQAGREILDELGIPTVSPFVVWNGDTVYVAGNVSTTSADFPARKISGALNVLEWFPASEGAQMFYRVYAPLVTELVERADPE